MPFADAKQRFSTRVADYVRYRPGYPPALIDLLRDECGLTERSIIADIGSGTGKLAELFLKNDNQVFGVEPNAEMRGGGEEVLRAWSNFTSVNGSAEATTLADASVDFVTVGQAFHWFEPQAARKEFARILQPNGYVALIWNDRRMEESPFARDYENLLQKFGNDYASVKDSYPEADKIGTFFGADAFQSRDLPNHQDFDWEALAGRLRSSSYAPLPADAKYTPMMTALENIFRANEHVGVVRMNYFTRIYYGHLREHGN
jgi:ubiquinone/menaquinone biosynthesis C-methylase UbiE